MRSSRSLVLIFTLIVLCLLASCVREAGSTLDTEAALRGEAKYRLAKIEGRIGINGLRKPVTVLRDKWGVPHIYAENMRDLFFAQGFVAAQDRPRVAFGDEVGGFPAFAEPEVFEAVERQVGERVIDHQVIDV